MVLIDAWSSWCKPCRAQIPELVTLYERYNKKGFEIIGVSIDHVKAAWLQAINADGQTWRQFCELKQWSQNQFVKDFSIMGIPANFLIDRNGILIGQDLSPEQIDRMVRN
jgi:thiol-disulfide isomerase/thioredoxin